MGYLKIRKNRKLDFSKLVQIFISIEDDSNYEYDPENAPAKGTTDLILVQQSFEIFGSSRGTLLKFMIMKGETMVEIMLITVH